MRMSPEAIQARLPREHGLLKAHLLRPCLAQWKGRQADLPVGCARRQCRGFVPDRDGGIFVLQTTWSSAGLSITPPPFLI